MSAPARMPAGRIGALLLAALSPAACRSVDARVQNLRQLHDEEGRHRRSAVLMSELEYNVRFALAGLFQGAKARLEQKPPEAVDDPLEECLENAIALERAARDDPRGQALATEIFGRLAVFDPWQLSRERAVRELGHSARRLGLADHRAQPLEGPHAGPDDVLEALRELIRAATPLLGGTLPPGEAAPDLTAACARVRGLSYDLNGALRALRGVTELSGRQWAKGERFAPARDLALDLQRLVVERALELALADAPPDESAGSAPGWPSERVRAAAVEAAAVAFGDAFLAERLDALGQTGDEAVVLAVLALVERRGLPHTPDGENDRREGWIEALFAKAARDPEGIVRAAAMRALGTASGGAVAGLREEEAFAWMRARARKEPAAEPALIGEGGP